MAPVPVAGTGATEVGVVVGSEFESDPESELLVDVGLLAARAAGKVN